MNFLSFRTPEFYRVTCKSICPITGVSLSITLRAMLNYSDSVELKKHLLLLLLAFQIFSGHVLARFFSYAGIPTPRCKCGRLHSDFVGFDMHAESLSV